MLLVDGVPLNRQGTEVDWLRVFWGVHTDGAAPPSFTTIARWIRDCGTLGDVSAYQDLDECADARPGDSLEVNWNANVPDTAHNIDQ